MNDQLSDPIEATPSQTEAGNILDVSGTLDTSKQYTELWMKDGRVLRVPTALLMEHAAQPDVARAGQPSQQESNSVVIPVIEETLSVGKRVVETGKIRILKNIQEHQETLNEPLAVRTFDIERVVINHPVDSPPAVREEGSTTVYSVVEEQLILTKQLILREEIRVTRRDTERHDNQVVTLRREHVVVDRQDLGPNLNRGYGLRTINFGFIYETMDCLVRAITALDFDTSKTWTQAAAGITAPLGRFYNDRGLLVARTGWDANATRLMFQPR